MMIAACTAKATPEQSEIMDRIEGQVQLPANASPLRAYARYYARAADGNISAVYFLHDAGALDDAKALCARENVKHFPCGDTPGSLRMIPNGERAWLSSADEFPLMHDGGCAQIRIHFLLKEDRADFVECNGSA